MLVFPFYNFIKTCMDGQRKFLFIFFSLQMLPKWHEFWGMNTRDSLTISASIWSSHFYPSLLQQHPRIYVIFTIAAEKNYWIRVLAC